MARPYRAHYWVDCKGKKCKQGTPGAKKKTLPKWYGTIIENGVRKSIPLAEDLEASKQLLYARLSRQKLEAEGLVRPRSETATPTLLEHLLQEWELHLQAEGKSWDHYHYHVQRVRSICESLTWETTHDLDAQALTRELHRRRNHLPRPEWGERPFGVTTSNHYLRACKAFAAWLVGRKILHENPFTLLQQLPADPRRERRSLTPVEFQKLIVTTRKSQRSYRNLNGPARALLYETAAATGLRAQELAKLTLGHLEGDSIRQPGREAKNRKAALIPLPGDLAGRIRQWADGKDGPLWDSSWWYDGAKMLRADLKAAGIPATDSHGRVVDFHALRVQLATNLARAGVSLQAAQKLMRHSSPNLTANLYTKFQEEELRAAAEAAHRAGRRVG